MTQRERPGEYKVGEIQPTADGHNPRPSKCGTYGVIKAELIEEDNHLEWTHICSGILKRSKWVAYRIGPGDNGAGTRTDMLKACNSKSEAVEWVQRKYKRKFTKTF